MIEVPPCPVPPPPPPAPLADRDGSGRVKPGNIGRPKGSRNKRSIALEALFDGEAEDIARKAVELAKDGDATCIRIILDRLAPPRKGGRIQLNGFPKVVSLADVPAAHAFLVEKVAKGVISPDESAAIAGTLDRYCAAVEAVDIEKRLAALENRYAPPQP